MTISHHRRMRPLLAASTLALLLCLSLSHVHAGEHDEVSSETHMEPRVLLIGNEMITTSQTTLLLDGLFQSAGWVHSGTRASRLQTHLHDGYTLGPNPLAPDFDASHYDFLDATHGAPKVAADAPLPVDRKHPRSTPSPEDDLHIVSAASRVNVAAHEAVKPVTTGPGVGGAGVGKSGVDLLAETTFRLMFPSPAALATSPAMEWLPYDNDTARDIRLPVILSPLLPVASPCSIRQR